LFLLAEWLGGLSRLVCC